VWQLFTRTRKGSAGARRAGSVGYGLGAGSRISRRWFETQLNIQTHFISHHHGEATELGVEC